MSCSITDDEEKPAPSVSSRTSSQPLPLVLADSFKNETNSTITNQIEEDDDSSSSSSTAAKIRINFLYMSTLFAINHGCSVSCLGLANARLGSIGIWQSGVLYASYTASALFGASYFVKRFGSRNGLVLGMGMNAAYVTSFFLVTLIVGKNEELVWLQNVVAIVGALVGGVGSSILWVSQGTYFSCASQLFVSNKEREVLKDVTSRFGGNFAFIFLSFEVILRLLSTLLIETVGLSWEIIFGVYSLLSILPTISMMRAMDMEIYQSLQNNNILRPEDDGSDEGLSPLHKATAALDLLCSDPKTKYLSPVNILFGLSTAFCSSVLNGEVIQKVLSDPNSTYVGLYTAVTSTVAAVASLVFGRLESTHISCLHCGKEVIMSIGASSYLVIALIFFAFPDGSNWNRASLLSVYILLGVGRATFEGTLRAIFADFFPNEKEGAFANIILFSGTASTLGYALSVSGALECEEVSKHCIEYSDNSIHNVLVMEIVIVAVAILSIPSFWRAVWMFRQEGGSDDLSIEISLLDGLDGGLE
mmetsp:Transcript_25172/g.45357  ORF Transcript_25172/g.45357 Transcript_25172/m.45357 type:complete len:532 (+) Transcript_25172:44-1639(+)